MTYGRIFSSSRKQYTEFKDNLFQKRSYLVINRHLQINNAIKSKQLRVIGPDDAQLGILSKEEALKISRSNQLDLVVVAPDSNPPVARVIDWGKYSYQKDKRSRTNRKATKSNDLKQMRFGLKIGDHDVDVKLRKVSEFLTKNFKVKITIILRGREMEHKDLAFDLARKLVEKLNLPDNFDGRVVIDQPPRLTGRQINFVIRQGK